MIINLLSIIITILTLRLIYELSPEKLKSLITGLYMDFILYFGKLIGKIFLGTPISMILLIDDGKKPEANEVKTDEESIEIKTHNYLDTIIWESHTFEEFNTIIGKMNTIIKDLDEEKYLSIKIEGAINILERMGEFK